MEKNKVTMIIYCHHGKFRITDEEWNELLSQRDKTRHPMLRLQEIREEKKKSEIAGL